MRKRRPCSEETKEKIRAAQKGRPLSPEHRAKLGPAQKEGWASDKGKDSKKRIAALNRKRLQAMTPEERTLLTAPARKAFRERMSLCTPTSLEKMTMAILDSLAVTYEFQKPFDRCVADFFIAPSIIIEVDGSYWHDDTRKKHDYRRDMWLRRQGFIVMRITEQALRRNATEAIVAALEEGARSTPWTFPARDKVAVALEKARRKAEKTHCANGHKRTPENTAWYGTKRRCRMCSRLRTRRYRSRKREQR